MFGVFQNIRRRYRVNTLASLPRQQVESVLQPGLLSPFWHLHYTHYALNQPARNSAKAPRTYFLQVPTPCLYQDPSWLRSGQRKTLYNRMSTSPGDILTTLLILCRCLAAMGIRSIQASPFSAARMKCLCSSYTDAEWLMLRLSLIQEPSHTDSVQILSNTHHIHDFE